MAKKRVIPVSCVVKALADAVRKGMGYDRWIICLPSMLAVQVRSSVSTKEVQHAKNQLLDFIKANPSQGVKILALVKRLKDNQTPPKPEPKLIQTLRQFKAGNCGRGSTLAKAPKKHEWKARLVFSNMVEPNRSDKMPRRGR